MTVINGGLICIADASAVKQTHKVYERRRCDIWRNNLQRIGRSTVDLSEFRDFAELRLVEDLYAAAVHENQFLVDETGKRAYGIGGGHV